MDFKSEIGIENFEIFRVLKPTGKFGVTDITIENELPDKLKNIITHVACIAGALPVAEYQMVLFNGGFSNVKFEDHSYAIQELYEKISNLILSLEMVNKLCECDVDLEKNFGITPKEASDLLRTGYNELEKGNIGYGLFIGAIQIRKTFCIKR